MSFKRLIIAVGVCLPLALTVQAAEPLVMVVQPINSEATTRANDQPLVDYLAQRIGQPITLKTVGNYLVFWGMSRRDGQFDIALDAAHTTAYRIATHGDQVIARIPSKVSFSLLTREDSLVLDVDELARKKIATLPSPALGAIRLLAWYPNPSSQPVLVRAVNTEDAIAKLREGKVDAAIIPSPLVAKYEGVNVVEVTDSVPAPAISVSAKVPAETVTALRKALLGMADDPEGKKVLAEAHLPGFVAASDEDYAGYDKLLDGVWGYQPIAGGANH